VTKTFPERETPSRQKGGLGARRIALSEDVKNEEAGAAEVSRS